MENLGAIDIGSNAIRVMVGGIGENGKLKTVEKCREAVRLGHEVFTKGQISPEIAEKAIDSFLKFQKIFKTHKVKINSAVATSAVREAKNGNWFVREVKKQTGLEIKIIDYKEEARLISLAVQRALSLGDQPALLFDIGGGSVEFMYLSKEQMKKVISLPMGTVRLLRSSKTDTDEEKNAREVVEPFRKDLKKFISGLSEVPVICAGTGGNIDCLGELRLEYLGKKSLSQIKLTELRNLIKDLVELGCAGRQKKLGLRKDRADVILPAALIAEMVMEESGLKKIRIPRVGLREGLIHDLGMGDVKKTG